MEEGVGEVIREVRLEGGKAGEVVCEAGKWRERAGKWREGAGWWIESQSLLT